MYTCIFYSRVLFPFPSFIFHTLQNSAQSRRQSLYFKHPKLFPVSYALTLRGLDPLHELNWVTIVVSTLKPTFAPDRLSQMGRWR